METSGSGRWRRMKEASKGFWAQFAFMPFLKRVCRATTTRAHWLALGLLVFIGIFSFWNTFTLIETNHSQVQLRALQSELHEVLSTMNDAETGQRGYLLVGEESYLEPYRRAVKVADPQIELVEKLMYAVPGQRSTFDAMQQLMAIKFADLKTTIQLRQSAGVEAALQVVRTGEGKQVMDEIRGRANQIQQKVRELLARSDRATVGLAKRATLWGILGSVVAIALLVLVMQRELRERTLVEERAQFEEGALAQARCAEASRIEAAEQSEREIESLGQRARELANFVQTLQERTLKESDEEIEALGRQARELARSVEASRIQTLNLSEGRIKALGEQARELARSVETSRIRTLNQSEGKVEAMGQQARELARSVETSRIQTLNQSEGKVEALGQLARELARSVEMSRIQTLAQSDGKIRALGEQARKLATSVESSRIETLNVSDEKIEALGQQARELATFVETARIQALNQSNQEIRTLNEGLEQHVLVRTAQLEAANKELDAFSYSVSHDLRAPLRAIDGFSRILLEDYGDSLAAEGKVYLQMVRDNTQQMGHLVDGLLAFARLGRQPLAKHTVDQEKLVQRCLEEMAKEREGRQVEIVIGDLPACQADPTLLKQVWTNLLSNALKYTRKRDSARIEIGSCTKPRPASNGQPISAVRGGSEVTYFVKDNGAGFDMKYVSKLFGVFQRLHRAADYEGSGVGLAIVQRIVQRHGGRIWAEAKSGQGATFSFTLA